MEVISPDGEQSTCSRAAAERLQALGWTVVPSTAEDDETGGGEGLAELAEVTRERDDLQKQVAERDTTIEQLEADLAEANATIKQLSEAKTAAAPGIEQPPKDSAPPVAPRGNESRDKWAEYATALGITVAEDASRDDIKAAVAGFNK